MATGGSPRPRPNPRPMNADTCLADYRRPPIGTGEGAAGPTTAGETRGHNSMTTRGMTRLGRGVRAVPWLGCGIAEDVFCRREDSNLGSGVKRHGWHSEMHPREPREQSKGQPPASYRGAWLLRGGIRTQGGTSRHSHGSSRTGLPDQKSRAPVSAIVRSRALYHGA